MHANCELFFRLPVEMERLRDAVCSVITAVPINWTEQGRNRRWFSAFLEAPQDRIEAEGVIAETGLKIGRFDSDGPIIVGEYDQDTSKSKHPNYYAIVVDRKLPAFVHFYQIGYDFGMGIDEAITVACGFVRQGYSGWFSFSSDAYRNHEIENPERCDINMTDFYYHSIGCSEMRILAPPAVLLRYYEQYGGNLENIQSTIDLCQNLGLEQFEPQIPQSVSAT